MLNPSIKYLASGVKSQKIVTLVCLAELQQGIAESLRPIRVLFPILAGVSLYQFSCWPAQLLIIQRM